MQIATTAGRNEIYEEQFFRKLGLERKREAQAKITREALRAETGTQDDAVLDALREIGFDRDTLPAIEWIPLVLVAWADGGVTPPERDAILRAIEGEGVPERHPAHGLVRRWLEIRPGAELLATWRAYVAAIAAAEPDEAQLERACRLRRRTREVAEADGGFLGFGRISRVEGAVLLEVDRVLRAKQTS